MKISRSQLRRFIVKEVTKINTNFASLLVDAMISSNFWRYKHRESDVDLVDKHTFSTDAIEVLMDALNDASSSFGSDIYFLLSVTDDELYTLDQNDKHGGYPNNWIMRGQYRGPEKGKHIVWLEFRPLADSYDIRALNPKVLVGIISRTINHELVHYNQLKKQATSKGISEEEAWEELQCDPNQLPVNDPKEWEKKCGKKPPKTPPGREGYLSLHNEIDAYAYEAAEELLNTYTPEQSIMMLKMGNLKSSPVISDYYTYLENRPKDIQNFMKKVYTHLSSAANK